EADEPLIEATTDEPVDPGSVDEIDETPEGVIERLARMGFSERLKAAFKGSREMRAALIRDPNKTISAAGLSSPKLTEPEVEWFGKMANLSDDVLRTIGQNRAWTRNYGILLSLTKNPKTPLATSLTLLPRLIEKDLVMVSMDRNVPDPLRRAARQKVMAVSG